MGRGGSVDARLGRASPSDRGQPAPREAHRAPAGAGVAAGLRAGARRPSRRGPRPHRPGWHRRPAARPGPARQRGVRDVRASAGARAGPAARRPDQHGRSEARYPGRRGRRAGLPDQGSRGRREARPRAALCHRAHARPPRRVGLADAARRPAAAPQGGPRDGPRRQRAPAPALPAAHAARHAGVPSRRLRTGRDGVRVPRAARAHDGPHQGRRALSPGRRPGRGVGARDVDDLEVRARQAAVRRCEGGVRIDPGVLSTSELQRLTRRYTAELVDLIGPETDIPAPDMGTDEHTMAWMMDTYSAQVGRSVPAVVTGKPVVLGGAPGRTEATGRGVVYLVQEAARHRGIDLRGATAIVQGFGNVGSHAARFLADAGVRVIGVSDVSGGLYDPHGLDLAALSAHAREHRSLAGCTLGERVTNAELLELPCDILVPAALQNQITAENADRIRCKIVAEGANGPTTLEADEMLSDRGVFVLPDILANAGGVTVSYFEWVQARHSYFWTLDEVNSRLQQILVDAFSRSLARASGAGWTCAPPR
ncbi:MAG: Glu/Leu/Phe/Val dehydrogenase [Sandaracinaceae bacterium]|nr:Glu/Leu/Phe/Val dehydrogenase [Sandaracinaceae bacterium]